MFISDRGLMRPHTARILELLQECDLQLEKPEQPGYMTLMYGGYHCYVLSLIRSPGAGHLAWRSDPEWAMLTTTVAPSSKHLVSASEGARSRLRDLAHRYLARDLYLAEGGNPKLLQALAPDEG